MIQIDQLEPCSCCIEIDVPPIFNQKFSVRALPGSCGDRFEIRVFLKVTEGDCIASDGIGSRVTKDSHG